jgi:hypothetical protein
MINIDEIIMDKLEKIAWNWISADVENIELDNEFYCKNREVFQARLERVASDITKVEGFDEEKVYITIAMAGEIGNNAFDHNLGSWRDVPGLFFGCDFSSKEMKIILADRGQGVLKTLRQVKPEIANHQEALEVAFTQVISGRAPESRGNGLKFVRTNVNDLNMHLDFFSGNAKASINKELEIKKIKEESVRGCLAILKINN